MSDYQKKLQEVLLKIPKGKVTTYKKIAHALDTKGYKFVGTLLGKNPFPDEYPCYKVVNSNGKIGEYSLGKKEKINRLKRDGLEIVNDKIVNFEEALFKY